MSAFYSIKRCSVIVLAILASMPAYAKFVKSDKALEIARSFFAAETRAQASGSDLEIIWPQPAQTRAAADIPSYYIINRTDGKGFVVVSAESETPEILAYSNEGAFNLELKDEGADLFLDSYERAIEKIRLGAPASDFGGLYEETVLKTVNWNQSGVHFNSNYAPKQFGRSCVSGCVATAMSIIMKYHNWPEMSSGYHEYYCSSLGQTMSFDYDSITYSWETLSDYPTGIASDEVSKIQKACGVAVNMNYGNNESSTYFCLVSSALRKYFYYQVPLYLYRSSFDKNEWDAILMDEINMGRPVFIGGYGHNGGHAFVLDGYNSNGVFHYNLGWGGQNNGFYRSELVSGEYGADEALVGILPRDVNEEDNSSMLSYRYVDVTPDGNISDMTVFNIKFMYLMNVDNDDINDKVRLDLYDESGNFKFTLSESYWPVGLKAGYYYDSFNFDRVMIPSGKKISDSDRFILSTSNDNGITWKPVICRHHAFPHYTLGGYDHDAFIFSRITYNDQNPQIYINTQTVKPEEQFAISVPMTYNTAEKFDGNYGVAICDTSTMKVKYVLSYKPITNLGKNFCINATDFNVKIPKSFVKELTPRDAISMVAKAKKDTEYRMVTDYYLNPIVIGLQSVMDIDLSVPSIDSDTPGSVYTIDGRKSDTRTKGLYLQQFPNSKARKIYITE